jgi:hypothetical protein
MFRHLEGDQALVVLGGVYRVADLYERDGKLFAAISGGYVRINANGLTSKDKMRVESLVTEEPLYKDRFGRLCIAPGPGRDALAETETRALLEPPTE